MVHKKTKICAGLQWLRAKSKIRLKKKGGSTVHTWMLDEVGLYQVVENVVFMNPLHRAAAGGAKGRAFHPARIAGSTEDMHARLQTTGKKEKTKPTPLLA